MPTTSLERPFTPSRIEISIEDITTKVASPVQFKSDPIHAVNDNEQDYDYDVDQGWGLRRRRGQYQPSFRSTLQD
ncbi:hypothetical protein M595_3029 [Lyngbya aestuarii BL J]|uniref:Uncharacterized protein n=1 Tax=Lyngbya aestuarii BL J TaxID=1348334 RepID=U7QGL3_9CYAN|nr:hypothetical protein [Lyngbya aestuarii]ERT07028.1 hypothetical protein M595_3029 [Lyngbya aestuarii BL J]